MSTSNTSSALPDQRDRPDRPGSPDQPVLVGVDGRPGSAGAVRYAVAEARRRRAPLQLVHVVPSMLPPGPPLPHEDLHRIGGAVLEEVRAEVARTAPDLDVSTVFAHGEPAPALVRASETAQLVVIGRESRRGVDKLVSGPATAAIAARTHCSAVVVPSFWTPDAARSRVVVGVKSQRDTQELVAQAFAEAAGRGAALTLVTAWRLPDPYADRIELRGHAGEWDQRGRALLEEIAAPWRNRYPDVVVDTEVRHGSPSRVLLKLGATADLLVVGRRRLAIPPYGHLGGVGHTLLRLAEAPVQVVPFTPDPVEQEDLVLEDAGAMLR